MKPHEEAMHLACAGETLIGVLALPQDSATAAVAVVVVVGGPQYRVGSHRQFVQLARRLAAGGYPTLRFDVRGMGDSSGQSQSFESLDADIAAAVDSLHARLPHLAGVVLWGLCDGASAALLYWRRVGDRRVVGLALLNPWLRTAEGLARTHIKHYYRQRVMERQFWSKVLSGRVAWQAASSLLVNIRLALRRGPKPTGHVATPDFRNRMAAAWHTFPGPMLLITSGRDYTAQEFLDGVRAAPAWRDALTRRGLTHQHLELADHTLSNDDQRVMMETATLRWLGLNFGQVQGTTRTSVEPCR